MGRNVVDSLVSSYNYPTIDNFVFRLCYRWTVGILVVFGIIVTCKLTLGTSFSCSANYDGLPQRYLDAKCYSEPLYTKPDSRVREEMSYSSQRSNPSTDVRIYHSFYSWVNLVFFAQAVVFYLPHLLWETYESGFVRRLTAGLQVSLGKEHKRSLELHCLAKYVLQVQGKHRLYTLMYVFFEVCNFGVALGQTLWLMSFFSASGIPDFMLVDFPTWSEYGDFYFPSSARCRMKMMSASGTTMILEALCALPLNRLYMKMYLFLRAWYVFLVVATGVVLAYRIALLTSCLRVHVIRCLAPFVQKSNATSLCHQMSYGDWFFLTAIRKAIPELEFSKLLDRMLAISQNKVKEPHSVGDDEDRSSVYEDTHKDVITLSDNTSL